MRRHNTPLRYPGGKQKLSPFVVEVMEANGIVGGEYCEPYAGGAGVAVELLLRGLVSRIHINDKCRTVFAFWHSVLHETNALCRRVRSASLTIEEWRIQREMVFRPEEFDLLDVGFAMLFLNRCNRSGIARGGVIGGLDQSGPWKMDARFNRIDLARRIQAIADLRDQIRLTNLDAEDYILNQTATLPAKSLVYCDPPYFEKSDRLYLNRYKPEDHARIAKLIQGHLKRPWLVSYDNHPEIQAAYAKRRRFTYDLQYNAAKAYKGTEVFIFGPGLRIPTQSSVPCVDAGIARLAG